MNKNINEQLKNFFVIFFFGSIALILVPKVVMLFSLFIFITLGVFLFQPKKIPKHELFETVLVKFGNAPKRNIAIFGTLMFMGLIIPSPDWKEAEKRNQERDAQRIRERQEKIDEREKQLRGPLVIDPQTKEVKQVMNFLKPELDKGTDYKSLHWNTRMGRGGYTVFHRYKIRNEAGEYKERAKSFLLDNEGQNIRVTSSEESTAY